MFVAGVIFFVGGILETVITIEDPDWFLFFPYKIATMYSQGGYACLGLFMMLSGLALLVVGISFAIIYASDGKYYMNQLKEAYLLSHISLGPTAPSAKELETGKDKELKECTNYLTDKMGFSEVDAVEYCSMLGRHWRDLARSEESAR